MKRIGISCRAYALLCAVLVASAQHLTAAFSLEPDRDDGVYEAGQTVRWTITWDGEAVPADARYRVSRGQLVESAAGSLAFTERIARVESTFTGPGSLLLEVTWTGDDGKADRATSGVVAAPGRIALSAPRPEDFSTFWAERLAELRAVPANPRLTAIDADDASLAYWKVTMDNIRGSTLNAQLARPTAGSKFPALLIVQWAGVYGLQKSWVTDRAREGWLVLNVMPHELPIDEPEASYKAQGDGPLKNYWAIGNDSRDTSYYLRMYLSCVRGADYLAGRDDWDGRTLVVMGGSQGGMQALVTAALHPRITAALATVPAGCDMHGPVVGRKGGWPQWWDWTNGKAAGAVREASRYFDVANFAPDIRCPVLVSAGLRDEVCPPEGILAAFNQITAPKELVLLPRGGHGDENNSHAPYNTRCYEAWLPALRTGQSAPVPVDAAALKRAEGKAERLIGGLRIEDATKAAQARATLADWLVTLWAWHGSHDAELGDLWRQWNAARAVVPKDEFPAEVIAQRIDTVYASLQPAYRAFLDRLATTLSAEQIDALKEAWSRSPGMARTYHAYLEIAPDLTEEQKKVIHDRMLLAREDAMLTDADKEITTIYKRHKVKVEAYIGSLEWAKLHRAFANRAKQPAAPAPTPAP
ncbi:MAG: acetylxylan esterase [Opitutaceae bacterium]|nr:acetylxylan esterase [Opitutaceae bacterium]